jgi:hypothetical protein
MEILFGELGVVGTVAVGFLSLVGLIVSLVVNGLRSAINANTAIQKDVSSRLEKLSASLDSHKAATEAETRAIRADLAIHERRLDNHDDLHRQHDADFRRAGIRPAGSTP